jgi:HlyD family secretion protein
VLDDEQIRARGPSRAAVRRPRRGCVGQHQITVLNESLRQNEIGVDQSRGDAQGKVSEAEGRLAQAEAQLAQAEASYTQAKWDKEAFARLFQRELIAEQEARRAQSTEEAQAAVVSAARRQVEAARGALMAAKARSTTRWRVRMNSSVNVSSTVARVRQGRAAARRTAESHA